MYDDETNIDYFKNQRNYTIDSTISVYDIVPFHAEDITTTFVEEVYDSTLHLDELFLTFINPKTPQSFERKTKIINLDPLLKMYNYSNFTTFFFDDNVRKDVKKVVNGIFIQENCLMITNLKTLPPHTYFDEFIFNQFKSIDIGSCGSITDAQINSNVSGVWECPIFPPNATNETGDCFMWTNGTLSQNPTKTIKINVEEDTNVKFELFSNIPYAYNYEPGLRFYDENKTFLYLDTFDWENMVIERELETGIYYIDIVIPYYPVWYQTDNKELDFNMNITIVGQSEKDYAWDMQSTEILFLGPNNKEITQYISDGTTFDIVDVANKMTIQVLNSAKQIILVSTKDFTFDSYERDIINRFCTIKFNYVKRTDSSQKYTMYKRVKIKV